MATHDDPRDREQRKRALEWAALLLLLERRAKHSLQQAMRLPLGLRALGGTPAHIQNGIRVAGRKAIVGVRQQARQHIHGQWVKRNGVAVRLDRSVVLHADQHRAAVYGDSLAGQWGKSRQVALADGADEDEAVRRASDAIESAVDRTAVTETAQAFNDEIAQSNEVARSLGYEVVEVWEGILDRRTCPECEMHQGESRVSPDLFVDRPPLHPLCRCFIDSFIRAREAA